MIVFRRDSTEVHLIIVNILLTMEIQILIIYNPFTTFKEFNSLGVKFIESRALLQAIQ